MIANKLGVITLISDVLKDSGRTKPEIADHLGTTRMVVERLMNRRYLNFTMGSLVGHLKKLGYKLEFQYNNDKLTAQVVTIPCQFVQRSKAESVKYALAT